MKTLCFLLMCGGISAIHAQDTLTLQQCLEQAMRYDLQEASALYQVRKSTTELNYHPLSLLPDLSGTVGLNTYFGRRVDPYTNTFATSQVNSNSFGLSTGITLFNGGYYFHEKKRLTHSLRASETNLAIKRSERLLRIIELYTALASLELEKRLCYQRVEVYTEVQRKQRLLLLEGRITVVDTLRSYNSLLEVRAQLEGFRSDAGLKTYQLNFLAGYELQHTYHVHTESISNVTVALVAAEKLTLQQLENELAVSQEQYLATRSNALPSLVLSGSLGTGFSTNNKDYNLPGAPVKPYGDQLSQNLYEGVGFSLQIPLFNKGTLLKARSIQQLTQTENLQLTALTQLQLEEKKAELEQQLLYTKASETRQSAIADNLKAIFDQSMLLYAEGKLTYKDIESAITDWQAKLSEVARLRLQHDKLQLLLRSF